MSCHVMHWARALAVEEMWRYIALVGTLISMHGFNSLKCSVTPHFLLIDHFLCQLSTFCEKLKKICIVEVWFFPLFCPRIIKFCYYYRVRKILGNYAEFPGGHILQQKRFIMRQIMRFLLRSFLIEHVLSWDSQQHWRFQRLCMMFPMLNSLKLEFYVCYFGQLMHFLSIKRFLMDYAIGCDSRSIVRNRTTA